MNICVITSSFPAARDDVAYAPFLLEVVPVLQRAGHRVSVLTQAREADPHPPIPDLDVVWFPWRRAPGRLAELELSSPSTLLSAASLISNGTRAVGRMRATRQVDAFFCAWVIPSGLYVWLHRLLSRQPTPYVLWALGSDINRYKAARLVRLLLTQIVARAAHVYADGHQLCDDIHAITGRECEFLPTFRAFDLGTDGGARPARDGPPRFLYVGRHAAVKGTDVLVDALIALQALGSPDYRCDLVGDGELHAPLAQRIAAAGLSERVRFCGRLSDEGLAAAYRSADVVVIPSRSESIPLVMSEALQHGLPLIVTDVGDMGALVRRHRLGEVVPADDPLALAHSLARCIATPPRVDAAATAAVLSELTFAGAAPKLLRRLETLVAT